MLLMMGDESEDDIRFARRIVHNQILDGLLLISPTIDHPLIDELINANLKFVSADRIIHDTALINFCTVENVESSRQAVNHLIKLGRRKIAILVGDPRIIDSLDRLEGYKLALNDAQIPYDSDLVRIDKFTYESGYEGVQYLLDNNIEFDGIYASQSTIAVGAVNALMDSSIRLPDDVSLIAFDDLVESMYSRIAISTMRQPVLDKGYQMADILIDLIENKADTPIQRFLSPKLVIRESCGGLKTQ